MSGMDIRGERYQMRVNNPDAISDIDVLESIQSQYAASPHMLALLVSKAALADPGKDLILWYENMFNPRTAVGIGLDIWGRIVGIERTIEIENTNWFGFAPGPYQPFNQGIFWTGKRMYTSYELNDDEFREFIFWKAAANIASAEAPALNKLLKDLFPDKTCYVLEIRAMYIRVVTRIGLSDVQKAFFRRYGLIAKGAGVGVGWLDVPHNYFGFAGSGFAPFGQAPFWSGTVMRYR